jgi:hypothetical protein
VNGGAFIRRWSSKDRKRVMVIAYSRALS